MASAAFSALQGAARRAGSANVARQFSTSAFKRAAAGPAANTAITRKGQQVPEHHVVPTEQDMENDIQLAGLGYPQLPAVSRQLRPAKGWWDNQERINFNETLQENDDALSMWGPDEHKKPVHLAAAQLFLMSGVIATMALFIYAIQPDLPAARRMYPYEGLVKELSGTDDKQYAAVIKGNKATKSDDEEEDDE